MLLDFFLNFEPWIVSPGTHLMKNHESQSRINESQFKTQWVLTILKDARTLMKPDNIHLMSDPESRGVSRDFVSENVSTQGKTELTVSWGTWH